MYLSTHVMRIRFERLISHIESGQISAASKLCDKYIASYQKEKHSPSIDKYDIEDQLHHCSLLLLLNATSVAKDVCITMKQFIDDEIASFTNIKTMLRDPSASTDDIGALEMLPVLARDKIVCILNKEYY